MKFSINFTDLSASEFAALSAFAMGNVAALTSSTAMPANTADDDGGPVNTNAPAVDKDGLPWDERIHSSNRQLTDKGVWRRRRGVADHLVTSVESELRTKLSTGQLQPAQQYQQPPMQQPAPVQQMPANSMPRANYQMPPAQPYQQPPMQQPVQQMPPAQSAPMPTPMQQPAPVQQPVDAFAQFMQTFADKMQNGRNPNLTADYLAQFIPWFNGANGAQLNTITDLQTVPHLIPAAIAAFEQAGLWN